MWVAQRPCPKNERARTDVGWSWAGRIYAIAIVVLTIDSVHSDNSLLAIPQQLTNTNTINSSCRIMLLLADKPNMMQRDREK